MGSYILTLPLRIALRLADRALSLATHALGAFASGGSGRNGTSPTAAPAGEDRAPAARPEPRPRSSATPPSRPEAPPAPPVEPEPVHVSEEPVLVAGVADPGAEESPGAQVSIAEPWPGYRGMKAAEVIERVADAGPAELAVVQLYESTARRRKTVLAAVDRRLKNPEL